MNYNHAPVMLEQCLAALAVKAGGLYVDATLGAGGHAARIAAKLETGRLFGLDRDPEALRRAAETLSPWRDNVTLIRGDYRDMDRLLATHGVFGAHGILFDLGVSSPQFDDPARGFSYRHDSALDMRMDPDDPVSAFDIVNRWPAAEIKRILYVYGEENYAPLITAAIVKKRAAAPIQTTVELAELIVSALPPAARRKKGHPAKRSFMAIRMAVNDELEGVTRGLEAAVRLLKPGGRLAVISFHSVEDRAVKTALREAARGCICPPGCPVCICGHEPKVKLLFRKPVTPDPAEMERNRRAHSAKLRAAEKRE